MKIGGDARRVTHQLLMNTNRFTLKEYWKGKDQSRIKDSKMSKLQVISCKLLDEIVFSKTVLFYLYNYIIQYK